MRRKLFLLLSAVTIVMMCVPSTAHPGRTDENGGHRDSSTGEYHYHHGYPAHQHENGVCPYDYVDKTGQNSGGASLSDSNGSVSFEEWMQRQNASSGSSGVNIKSPDPSAAPSPTPSATPSKTFLPTAMSTASKKTEVTPSEFLYGILICLILFLCIVFANRHAARDSYSKPALGCLTYIIVLIFIASIVGLTTSCNANLMAKLFRSQETLVSLLCIFVVYSILATAFLISEWKYENKMRNKAASIKFALENKTKEAVKLKEFIDTSGIADPERVIPPGSKIGDDGLPCESAPGQRFRWGETYTFFASRYGVAFHRYGCEFSGNACQCNAIHVYGSKRPCRVCNPVLPDLSWYFEYQKRKEMQAILP